MKTGQLQTKLSESLKPFLILGILAFGLYANTLKLDYALDDTLLITGNEFTKKGLEGIPDILTNDAFTGFFGKQKNLVAGGRYRPLSQIMFAVEYEIFGPNPFPGHLFNVLLYVALALFLFHFLRKLLDPSDGPWWFSIAFVASLFFIAHPLHTEAVANVKGRDEILTMLFVILAWHSSLRYIHRNQTIHLVWSGLFFFLALMSKENSLPFIVVIPLSFYFFRKGVSKKQITMSILPLLITSAGFLALRYNALGFFLGGEKATELLNDPYLNATVAEKLATNLLTWGKYYSLLIFPHPLTHDYYPHFFSLKDFAHPAVLLSVLATLALAGYALAGIKKKHLLSFSILYFFITFSIMSNVAFNIGTFMNERFMFIPLLGYALGLAFLLRRWRETRIAARLPLYIGGLMLLAYSIKTISRNPVWQDDYTLFTTDVRVSHNSIKCNVSAGGKSLEKYEKTQDPVLRASLLAQAIPWLEKGVSLHPGYLAGWEQLGKATYYDKDYERAWLCYQNCLQIKPDSESAKENLGLVALMAFQEKDYPAAITYLKQVRVLMPAEGLYAARLADAYIEMGEGDKARLVLEEALAENPKDHLLLGKLGEFWGRYFGRLDRAEHYLLLALEGKPDYASALENLGIVYGMTGRLEQSLEALRKASVIEPENSRILTNIGNTLMMMGQSQEAEEYFSQAKQKESKD
jgi:tetratricopeptide (TPR) repeat protein